MKAWEKAVIIVLLAIIIVSVLVSCWAVLNVPHHAPRLSGTIGCEDSGYAGKCAYA